MQRRSIRPSSPPGDVGESGRRIIVKSADVRCSDVTAACETSAIVDWLTDGARSAIQPQQVLAELCDRLTACGVPLWRVAVFVRTLHPNVMGRRFTWRPDAEVELTEAPFELLETEYFRDSPIARVYQT